MNGCEHDWDDVYSENGIIDKRCKFCKKLWSELNFSRERKMLDASRKILD